MRVVVLDVETTGLNKQKKHGITHKNCIIEFAALEIIDGIITGRYIHHYIKPHPGILVHDKAFKIHGISNEFLKNKPYFKECASEILHFIRDATLVMHNANFDLSFLEKEFKNLSLEMKHSRVVDTLELARMLFPNSKNRLEDLAFRFDIPKPKFHGAFVDTEILTRIYLILCDIMGDVEVNIKSL